ncbi:MAG: T9SS type A sorting domain-containing protein [Chitinophagales bacterium]
MMKKKYSKKLAAYSALASPALLFMHEAKGQIEYSNPDPDISVSSDGTDIPPCYSKYYDLDIDNDAIDDLRFYLFVCTTTGFVSTTAIVGLLNPSEFDFVSVAGTSPKALNYGAPISNSLPWSPDTAGLLAYANIYTYDPLAVLGAGGNFYNKEGKFLAVRKIDDGFEYYGWVRLSLKSAYPPFIDITIHDYAFNNAANELISAGETGQDCNPPFQLLPVALSPTTETLKWQPVTGAEKYKIKYRQQGVAAWTSVLVDAPKKSKKLTGLTCEMDYEWKIASSCNGGATFSAFSDVKTFTTAECRMEEDELAQNEIYLYPNPVNSMLHIDGEELSEPVEIKIIDMNNKLVMEKIVEMGEMISADVSMLPPGVYIVSIIGEKTYLNKKIIKQ